MNCEHTTVIMRADAHRLVSTCKHGSIHINWDWATLHMNFGDFDRLARLLKEAGSEPDPPRMKDEGRCGLIRQQNDCYQLWLVNVALFLDPTDFLLFSDLVINARRRLGQQQPQPAATTLLRDLGIL
ncbi:MAG TPA: hypothetical protein PKE64_21960 [Anaerolineae bacterium]|nr:hypothetical protein [Anaerolineae bacterium]HMR66687.1 hypothetical protein [Anaerolineae bacterium]